MKKERGDINYWYIVYGKFDIDEILLLYILFEI